MDEIFSDIDDNCMRGSTAIQLLREREAAEGLVSVMVISCTGNASHESGKLLESGANFVWNKPFPSAEDGSMQRDIAMLLMNCDRANGKGMQPTHPDRWRVAAQEEEEAGQATGRSRREAASTSWGARRGENYLSLSLET